MLFERAEILVKEGTENEFAAAMRAEGLPILNQAPGARSVKFGQGVEKPNKFMLLIAWETMDAHIAFSKSDAFPAFTDIFKPYSIGGAMEHFNID